MRALLAVIVLASCKGAPEYDSASCEGLCAQVMERRRVVLGACGVPEAAVEVPCDGASVARLACQVGCMEQEEDCERLVWKDFTSSSLYGGAYGDCLLTCPQEAPR